MLSKILIDKIIAQLKRDRGAIHDEYCGHRGHNGDCEEIDALVKEIELETNKSMAEAQGR